MAYEKLRPAADPSVELTDFSLSMQVAPQALGRVLEALDDIRGVECVMLHGMSIVVQSTDEVL